MTILKTGDVGRFENVATVNDFDKLLFLDSGSSLKTADVVNVRGAAAGVQEVIVNDITDFPTQDSTTITLESGFSYLVKNNITTSKNFICEDNSSMRGTASIGVIYTYTGTGALFNCGSNVRFQVTDLGMDCPNGSVFDVKGTGTFSPNDAFLLQDSLVYNCDTIGTCDSGGLFLWRQATVLNCTGAYGIAVTGNILSNNIENYAVFGLTNAPAIDLTGSMIADSIVDRLNLNGGVGSVGITGDANSANIIPNARSVVVDSNFLNVATPLSGITREDVRWDFVENSGISDSRNVADVFLTAPETVTITTPATFVTVDGGNWNTSVNERFTTNAAGVATYNGEREINIKVSGAATVEKVGGGSDQIEVRVALNGATVLRSGVFTDNNNPTSLPIEVLLTINTGDTIDMQVANNNGTSNIIVDRANLVITEV